ncbi:MAG: alanyl-tRNA synthetase [Anaerophaga sp.]|uniref:alanine--tRNA ligase n=1 Tax=Anaerophaga thermohalophila TaxID=177400 RepID=UPI000237D3E6|nr:alanine--tRNA ligase [Anaerophaga thermohalophila]MDK2842517.1 alanyl-tRNA synthetase [Anaerophaga sp.]MDN5290192.1 alanyl-tRNA synthetase [Anaerophaga sp.]
MRATEVRRRFFDFFRSKQHIIVASAPMVVKNDPTLMFTNAGMNQFKDIFLGNRKPEHPRVANAQKCLRVSGKHNDLEEVGHDTYHHTMFEMLGNWSFGDYFKEEAIDWAWEFLTKELGIDKNRLYATVFEGDENDNVKRDEEAALAWQKYLPEKHIIDGNKKDNFWEMGDTGPCGPCSEIHIDLRDIHQRKSKPGYELVNKDHPEVIEIWNLVFIQYNRRASGELVALPQKHVDTGMGFERLCRVLQGKSSNYDTDIFQPIIRQIAAFTGIEYGASEETDIAMRVIADHLRTIAFSITDGQLPSNNKAGYVIRRILRRAVRYGYTFLNVRRPFMSGLIPALIEVMGDAYPELKAQHELIDKVIYEEEESFLKTLETGITLLDNIIERTLSDNYKVVSGKVAFELYDTYGFPLDLTELILSEKGLVVNRQEFDKEMEAQKARARNAASVETGDWVVLKDDNEEEFVGYDFQETEVYITRYRKVKVKNKDQYQLVFNITPFYAESGGQVGDSGFIQNSNEKIAILDTKKENDLIVHISNELPSAIEDTFRAVVNMDRRRSTARNHTATHLLHKALRKVLGNHVEQKGSLVHPDYLRFDFSHFQKVSPEDIRQIEKLVNADIRANINREEHREVPIDKAREMGAIALFGEKYGDVVRTIGFGECVELCGGTHVDATGEIGFFRIIGESSVSAGIRRIEAVSGIKAEELAYEHNDLIGEIAAMVKSKGQLRKNIENLINQNSSLSKQLENMMQNFLKIEKQGIIDGARDLNGVKVITQIVRPELGSNLKDLAFQLKNEISGNMIAVLGAEVKGKPQLVIIISDELVDAGKLNAVDLVRDISGEINGGGGGQPFFASAGGKNAQGLSSAVEKAGHLIEEELNRRG